jgi:DDE superfamily endonuclease
MATWQFPSEMVSWIVRMSCLLDQRNAWRLCPMLVGALFSTGRRTVASWLRAGGLSRDYEDFYYFLSSVGRKVQTVAGCLLNVVWARVAPDGRARLALDDTVTERYGPHVEGAGIHHNPTPGPADQTFAYGHVWVTMAWIVRHPWWGTIGLPLLANLYVRAKDVWLLSILYGWKFQTKLELAAELLEWAVRCLHWLKLSVWVVVDGGFTKRPFLRRALAAGAVVVGRLRKDAALFSVPQPPAKKGRGRPRKYGADRISLAKRAGARGGWRTEQFDLYHNPTMKTYKTFLATYPPVGGLVRVVLVREEHGWLAWFCTDRNATVREILEMVADRAAIEQDFHDLKEVHGAGQQQLRNVWANIGAFNLLLWLHTLVELWAWNLPHEHLCDRRRSPWDDPTRRPSHADRCKALHRACFAEDFSRLPLIGRGARKIRACFERLAALVT